MTKINLTDLEAKFHPLKRDLFVVAGDLVTVGDILALIRVARIAKEINDEYKHDLGHFSPVLEEALKEIDA